MTIVAISANFEFEFKNGYLNNFIITRDKIDCWINLNTDDGKIKKGLLLKKCNVYIIFLSYNIFDCIIWFFLYF